MTRIKKILCVSMTLVLLASVMTAGGALAVGGDETANTPEPGSAFYELTMMEADENLPEPGTEKYFEYVEALSKEAAWDAMPADDGPLKDMYFDAISVRQEPACAASDRMWEFFKSDCELKDYFDYPDYYAGMYVSEDDFKLHFSFVKGSEAALERCMAALSDCSDAIVFDGYTEYSFEELQTELEGFVGELEAAGCVLSSWYVDEFSCGLTVGVRTESFHDAEGIAAAYREAHKDIPVKIYAVDQEDCFSMLIVPND